MRKILLSLFAFVCFAFSAQAQDEGEVVFGVGINLWDVAEEIGIQGKAIYGLNETLDLSGAFTYYLDDVLDFGIDANVQYKGLDVSDSFKLNPLAGLSIYRLGVAGFSTTETAIHIGANFKFVLESGMTIYAEPMLLIDEGSGLNIAGGILF